MKFPCKDCPDRVLGCHASCEKYQFVKQERHREYMEYIEKKKVCADQSDYVFKQMEKQRKRMRRR